VRFNGHIRKLKAFSRKASLINWIEPTSFLLAVASAYVLYAWDVVHSYILLAAFVYFTAQVYIVIFSVSVMLIHMTPSQALTRIRADKTDSVDDEDQAHATKRSACKALRPPQVVRWDIVGVTLSNWFGKVNSIPLPAFIREPFYRAYARQYGANLDEIKLPLHSFRNLQEFFSRELKPGARPVADTPLVSPVDARVIVLGPVEGERVEQVKGVTYPLPSFLGEDIWARVHQKRLFHCVLYLAPGDYHRIHSGADCNVTQLRHFPGTLFPISPVVARLVPNLFALNERVVLAGAWEHGFFSSTAVGAYHVGSMAFNFDKNIRTNRLRRDFTNPNLALLSTKELGAYAYDFSYPEPVEFKRGDEVGTFKLGSTIVLIFEVPEDVDFRFLVEAGDKVSMGQQLGKFF
jgi:phosphatidylserine decarboxylase